MDFFIDFNLLNNNYYFYERLLILFFSLVPTILLVLFVLYTDRKSKEPAKNIGICLLSGFLTISLSALFEGYASNIFTNNVLLTYIWAFIEELSKIAIFYLFLFDNKHYDDIYDGLVYMMLIALSFAGLENILYAFSESTVTSGIYLAIMRDLTTIPLHVICGIVIGYFISLGNFSKFRKKKRINYLLALILPTFVHGTFNLVVSIISNINTSTSIGVLLFETIPLFTMMILLFMLAFKISKNAVTLNKIFINDGVYSTKYKYLMTNQEYLISDIRLRRLLMNSKIRFKKDKEDDL